MLSIRSVEGRAGMGEAGRDEGQDFAGPAAAEGARRLARRDGGPDVGVDERAASPRLHAHRRNARGHGALYRAAAAGRIRIVRLVASSRRRGGFRDRRDLLKRVVAYGAGRQRKIYGAGRHADLADGCSSATGADLQARFPRGFSLAHGARRLPHRRRRPGWRGHAARYAGRRRRVPSHAGAAMGCPARLAAVACL